MGTRADTDALIAAILNDWWMVRHYVRGGALREQAILKLGLTIGHAFSTANDWQTFEALITAFLDGGRPPERKPF